uniref:Mitochondrial import receptor subunit TOM22 homolog n=1 Tax=Sinocyclocheilus grahami TaxID=75366 RepID=A0A672Q4L4_SINGR
MAAIQELSPDSGRGETRPPEGEIEGDDEDEELDETLLERLWGLTEMFPESLQSAAEVSAQCSLSVAKKLYRCGAGSCILRLKPDCHINSRNNLDISVYIFRIMLSCSFSRSALWVGTTSFMILVLPVVFETERLQLEQQQLQQQRQILLGPNAGMSGGMPGMMPPAPGKL